MPKWAAADGLVNLAELYHLVWWLLSDLKDSWVIETLGWWQK